MADDRAPAFRQRSASGMSPVTTTVARVGRARDPVVGGVERVAHHHPLDQRMLGHADAVADDRPAPRAGRRPVDLVLHRAGVGIDQDLDGGGVVTIALSYRVAIVMKANDVSAAFLRPSARFRDPHSPVERAGRASIKHGGTGWFTINGYLAVGGENPMAEAALRLDPGLLVAGRAAGSAYRCQAPHISKPRPAPPNPQMPSLPPAVIDNTLAIGGDDIKARQVETRMTVEVMVNGRGPYRFLVDSGADTSVVGLRSLRTCSCRSAPR